MTAAKSIVLLDAGYQNYAWGKPAAQSFVAKMKNLTHETGTNFAELWVGTHPSCPSRIAGGTGELLNDFLQLPENKATFFSPAHQASSFRDTVPYLLKILSISTALSIQAHPRKELAEKLHAALPDKYKDPNHKPELIIALTAYEALCCFRPLDEIVSFLHAAPELATLTKVEDVLGADAYAARTLPAAGSSAEKRVLKSMMHNLYTAEAATCTAGIRAHLSRLQAAAAAHASSRCVEDELFVRLYNQYPDDVGCWMIYVLNYVQLQPGEGLFLSDSEPHAYLSGDGVEIMACSDNVVRGGLTPKWKDVPTLIEMLKYDTCGLAEAKHERSITEEKGSGWQVQFYQPPPQFPDFSIYRLEHSHDRGSGTAVVDLPTIGLGFCLEGSARINDVLVKAGDCFAVPFGQFQCQAVNQHCLVFISSTNDLKRVSKM